MRCLVAAFAMTREEGVAMAQTEHTSKRVISGDRYEALASQLQLICRYSVDRAASHHVGL